jgi:hypothetical protein
LAGKLKVSYVPSLIFQVMGFLKPITAPYFPLIIKPQNYAAAGDSVDDSVDDSG